MNNDRPMDDLEMPSGRQTSKDSVAFSLVLTAMGGAAALAPIFQNIVTMRLIGTLLFVGAALEIAFAFKAESFGKSVLKFLFGGLGILAGIVLIATPVEHLKLLYIVIIALFLANGVVEAALAMKLRPEKGWHWLLFSGIISILFCALLIIQWPLGIAWGMGIYIGIIIAMHGWVLMVLE